MYEVSTKHLYTQTHTHIYTIVKSNTTKWMGDEKQKTKLRIIWICWIASGLHSDNNLWNVKHRVLPPYFGLYFEFPMSLNHIQTYCQLSKPKEDSFTRMFFRVCSYVWLLFCLFGWMIFFGWMTRTHIHISAEFENVHYNQVYEQFLSHLSLSIFSFFFIRFYFVIMLS